MPAHVFFGPDAVRGRNLEVAGIGTQVTDPTHRRIDRLLDDRGTLDRFGADVTPVGVKYILLSKEADYRSYDFLDRQRDLSVVFEPDELVLYENEAFAGGSFATWTRAGPEVPLGALAGGALVAGWRPRCRRCLAVTK